MRKAPLVVAALVLTLLAGVTLHAAYWYTQVIASGGPLGFGYFNATALQHGTGYVHVAYSDGDRDDVKLSWWNGTAWQTQTVDAGRNVARGIDLAFNASNQPGVSYAGDALKFAERSGSSWTIKTVASGAKNDVTSLKYSNGQPSISYFVTTQQKKAPAVTTLKLASRNGTTWSNVSIAPGVRYSSLAFDAAGNPAIAYAGDRNGDTFADSLRLARKVGGTWQLTTIDDSSGAGTWARLAFDSAGSPMLVDSPTGVGIVRFWYQDAGGAWLVEQIGAGFRPALTVHQGVPIVSYVTSDGYGLVVARRDPTDGWSGVIAAAAGFGYIGQNSLSIPYGTGGEPAVAYVVDIFGINASRTLYFASPPGY